MTLTLQQVQTLFEDAGCDTLQVRNTQLVGECPWCGKPSHFYVSAETTWICHSCQEQGNWNTFLSKVIDYHKAQKINKKMIADLAKWRGIHSKTINSAGVVWDDIHQRYIIPYYGQTTPHSYRYLKSIGSKVLNPTGLNLRIYGAEYLLNISDTNIPVFICEGEWDTLKLRAYLTKARKKVIVVGVPGAGVFKKEWADLFKDRTVSLLYDNDEAGIQGMDKAESELKRTASEIHKISWPSTTPDKYDVSDYISSQEKHNADIKKSVDVLCKLIRPASRGSGHKPVPTISTPISFRQLLKQYANWIDMSSDYEQAIRVCLATVLSSSVSGDPLWLFLVGVPAGGKTIILNSMAADRDFAIMQSTITRPTLISGVKGNTDHSLLPELLGKCLIVKDYTEVLGLPGGAQEELYAALRGIYDGRVDRRLFGGTVNREYKGFMSMLAGTTLDIHGQNRATLGERFLKYQLVASDREDKTHALRALREMGRELERDEQLGVLVANFIRQRYDRPLPKVPKWQERRLIALASLVALLRTKISYNIYNQTFVYRPKPEAAARLTKQLGKLARFLAVVSDKPKIDLEIQHTVERVALDTAYGFGLDVFGVLAENGPMVISDISKHVDMPDTNLRKSLEEMRILKILKRTTPPQKTVGRPSYLWELTPKMLAIWNEIGLSSASKRILIRHRKGH